MSAPDVYYEIATKQLDEQLARVDAFDSKAATLFAASSGIIAIFAGLLALSALPSSIVTWVLAVVALAAAVYIVQLVLLFLAYRVGNWHMRPYIQDLQRFCEQYDEKVMREWVAHECAQSLKDNAPLLDRKAHLVNWALAVFPCEALLLVIAGGITLLAR